MEILTLAPHGVQFHDWGSRYDYALWEALQSLRREMGLLRLFHLVPSRVRSLWRSTQHDSGDCRSCLCRSWREWHVPGLVDLDFRQYDSQGAPGVAEFKVQAPLHNLHSHFFNKANKLAVVWYGVPARSWVPWLVVALSSTTGDGPSTSTVSPYTPFPIAPYLS